MKNFLKVLGVIGTHLVNAVYAGHGMYAGSRSKVVAEKVKP